MRRGGFIYVKENYIEEEKERVMERDKKMKRKKERDIQKPRDCGPGNNLETSEPLHIGSNSYMPLPVPNTFVSTLYYIVILF